LRSARVAVHPSVSVQLCPGCVFFEIAATVELLAPSCEIAYCTPYGASHESARPARR
jgi:hypothetical protein